MHKFSLVVLKVVPYKNYKSGKLMGKLKTRRVIQKVISKNEEANKKKISQLTIKIDERIDNALLILSQSLNISKNKLIEDILFESGIIEEVNENYL